MTESNKTHHRLESIDLLRGAVMVLMILDHTRDFVHHSEYSPLDLSQTTPALFFTRWITHLCAPIFVFLAGVSMQLQALRGKSKSELSKFLFSRGLWLVFCEFTLVKILISFGFSLQILGVGQVIWAIGVSMMVLAGLIYLPLRVIGLVAFALIAGHNALDGIQAPPWQGPGSPGLGFGWSLWMVLHQPGLLPLNETQFFIMAYPLVPWLGVMAGGYVFGIIYGWTPERRQRFLWRFGAGLIAAFVLLRSVNLYGDPKPWQFQASPFYSFLSFINLEKYPPSLDYLLVMLGIGILALALLESKLKPGAGRSLVTLGRVPFFFYMLQWLVAHLLGIFASMLAGKPYMHLVNSFFGGPEGPPPEAGFGLGMVYAMSLLGLALIYPLCKWFAGVKQRRRDWWLSYL